VPPVDVGTAQFHGRADHMDGKGLSKCGGNQEALAWLVPETQRENAMTASHHQDHKWSADATEHSDALDLEKNIFKSDDPKEIASSLKNSAEKSKRRKAEPYRSAMSMLTFYINRAGENLSDEERKTLEAAKSELRNLFGRAPAKA
jgi:phosphoenolpyruvate carboxylase